MLVALATMDFRLCHLLREKLEKNGFSVEQIIPGKKPPKGTIIVVTTKKEEKMSPTPFPRKVVLSRSDKLNINRAYGKILLTLEDKRIWESLIIGIDPGMTIGVAIVADSHLRASLETREINEAIDFVLRALKNNPAKMSIIRIGSTGGYRRVLILNELLNAKPSDIPLEIVDELGTTPALPPQKQEELVDSSSPTRSISKDIVAATEIAYRLGERIKRPEEWDFSEGELKEIQMLSRHYSEGEVTIPKDLARAVACGFLSIREAIEVQRSRQKEK
ncbi:MAG: hypothetical protein GF308_04085 [Candidatus Heimdallarchaeota archaeon]|nr:hypothetical protein [Candidatus Heimdallarchaeota archaeon]